MNNKSEFSDYGFKYDVGGIGTPSNGGAFGGNLGSQVTIKDPFANGGQSAPASVNSNSANCCNLGICICNVSSPSCTAMKASDNKWDALKAQVDQIIYGGDTTVATPPMAASTCAKQAKTKQAVNSAYYVVIGGVVVLGIAAVFTFMHMRNKGGKK